MAIKKDQLNKMMSEKNGMKITDNMDGEKNATEKLNIAVLPGIPKGLTVDDAIKTFMMSLDRNPKDLQEVIDFFKNRKLNKKLLEKSETIV